MVMPRSRSKSLESMTRSATTSLERNAPLWRNMASTSVVLPWSTWAMMAILRIEEFKPSLRFLDFINLYFPHGKIPAIESHQDALVGDRSGCDQAIGGA